jgi:hypothetical protein
LFKKLIISGVTTTLLASSPEAFAIARTAEQISAVEIDPWIVVSFGEIVGRVNWIVGGRNVSSNDTVCAGYGGSAFQPFFREGRERERSALSRFSVTGAAVSSSRSGRYDVSGTGLNSSGGIRFSAAAVMYSAWCLG